MKPAVARLMLTLALFAAWLGYLGYLVVCRPHTPSGLRGAIDGRSLTLSRPQFLVSMLDVVAEVSGDKGETVVVKEVLFPKTDAPVKAGDTISVADIDRCRALADPLSKNGDPPPDYTGPGLYLIPLEYREENGERRFRVVPTPSSPGFPPLQSGNVGPPRLYPATTEMLAEYRDISKP